MITSASAYTPASTSLLTGTMRSCWLGVWLRSSLSSLESPTCWEGEIDAGRDGAVERALARPRGWPIHAAASAERRLAPRLRQKLSKISRAPKFPFWGACKVSCGALFTTAQDWAKRTVLHWENESDCPPP
eukprot:6362248-Prymnesium_polylepis.2